jgi:hypothetical protein
LMCALLVSFLLGSAYSIDVSNPCLFPVIFFGWSSKNSYAPPLP